MSVVFFKADSKGKLQVITEGPKTCEDGVQSSEPDVTTEDLLESGPYLLIPKFESILFATVLENAILNCTILNACYNHLRVSKIKNDVPLLLVDKFGIEKTVMKDIVPDELDLIDHNRLGCEDYQILKLHIDRDDVMRVMQETYKGLVLSETFRPLWDFCEHTTNIELYRENLINDTLDNKVHWRTLKRELRHSRNQHTTARYEADGIIDELWGQIQNEEYLSAVRERYVCKWQVARTEQQGLEIDQEQEELANSIEYYKYQFERESAAHGQVELLVNIVIAEKNLKMEEVMAKYDADTEAMDVKIQILMSKNYDITEKKQKLAELLEKRTREIKDWCKFKEDRAEARMYHDKMTRSAVAVQAWWRGLLVRRQMGPYRQEIKQAKKKPNKKNA